jgi:hypothetical protein
MVSGTGPKWAQNSDFSTKMPEKYLSDQFFFVFFAGIAIQNYIR